MIECLAENCTVLSLRSNHSTEIQPKCLYMVLCHTHMAVIADLDLWGHEVGNLLRQRIVDTLTIPRKEYVRLACPASRMFSVVLSYSSTPDWLKVSPPKR
jgi:hypothetical protein